MCKSNQSNGIIKLNTTLNIDLDSTELDHKDKKRLIVLWKSLQCKKLKAMGYSHNATALIINANLQSISPEHALTEKHNVKFLLYR